MNTAVYCIAQNREHAECIVTDLKEDGFLKDEISVLFPDKSGTHDFAHEQNTKMPEGAAAGGAAGMGAGAILGWVAGLGSFAIPGVGPLIAAGPIMAALSGAAIGGAAGGLIGGLVGVGIPEYEARLYEGKIRNGNVLVSVHTENVEQVARARQIFERQNADNIHSSHEAKVPSL